MEIKMRNTESPSQGIQFVKNSVWLEQRVKVSNKITLGRQAGTKHDQPRMSEYNQSYTGEADEAIEDIWAAAFRRLVCILVWISLKAEPEMSTWVQKVYLGEGSREQEWEKRGGKSSIRVHYQGHFSGNGARLLRQDAQEAYTSPPRNFCVKDGDWAVIHQLQSPTNWGLPLWGYQLPCTSSWA